MHIIKFIKERNLIHPKSEPMPTYAHGQLAEQHKAEPRRPYPTQK